MNRQTTRRIQIKRPTNLTLRLQQSWLRDGQPSPQKATSDPPAPPKAA